MHCISQVFEKDSGTVAVICKKYEFLASFIVCWQVNIKFLSEAREVVSLPFSHFLSAFLHSSLFLHLAKAERSPLQFVVVFYTLGQIKGLLKFDKIRGKWRGGRTANVY